MTSQDFITNLPINNFHRFADYEEWLDFYSHHYPKEDQREEIYRLEDYQTSIVRPHKYQ